MNLEAIYHRSQLNWAYAYDHETLHIRIRAKKDDLTEVNLHSGDKYGWEQTKIITPMKKFATDQLFDYWEAAIHPKFKRAVYYFELNDDLEKIYLLEKGFVDQQPDRIYEGLFDFPYLNRIDINSPPEWVKESIFYQIFPERFANGDPSNDPEDVQPWGGTPTPTNFFGGDLQGVINHLDYLSELGINAIYFNPLFEATTNHKYDTEDYFNVDPHFGTNETLKQLVDACHDRGIRVLLDAVFNHCGKTFPPFIDLLENGEASIYKDWFYVREWPLTVVDGVPTYETFAFEPIMPKLNTENESVKEYLLGVAKYWIDEIGIDGWRLDVANEVDHQFWREFRTVVKTANPEAYILGEIMHDSMPWLQGDQFDAVMNYPFTNALLNFFAKATIDADGFAHAIQTQLVSYPQQITEASFNLMGSHDTTRLLTLCEGNKERLKLAYLFELTFYGAPCIYYGDEIGMDGEHDPLNRKCMEWDPEQQDQHLFAFFQSSIKLRKQYPALRTGDLRFVPQVNKQLLVYERFDANDHFIIVMNNAEAATTCQLDTTYGQWIDVNSSESITTIANELHLELPAFGYRIMKSVK
ncbi:MAG: alpha-glycosidase [Candidatus Pristimantibacillus lignocellulolyticus]|uniref:Alpha-glycosidase n=1 Tax=Candidatus Pristimantibacillus lignocellulolyticus TaxID=2994561 RepID=A0A9J6ZHJ4_9BACL|nr:MAG: alpha-glycosidase [Candidatus Pristimantibacillus lignocellulolyticus]